MANNVGVSPAELEKTIAILSQQRTAIKNQLSNIKESVNNMRSSWQSDAANHLSSIASKMEERFAALDSEVQKYETYMQQILANYETTESSAVTAMDQVMGMFN